MNFLRLKIRSILLLALPIVLFVVLSFFESLELSERHYIVFPIALTIFLFLFFRKWQRAVLPLIVVIPMVVFGARHVFSYSISPPSFSGIILARLQKDKAETKSSILREQIARFVKPLTDEKVERYFSPLRSHAAALRSFPRSRAVVWGDKKKVKISFQMPRDKTTPIFVRRGKKTKKFELITYVPGVSLSYKPIDQTGFFVGHVLASTFKSFPENETILKAAAKNQAAWTSAAHVAYPGWKLGNEYLIGGDIAPLSHGMIECAIDAYSLAAGKILRGEHSGLRSAIFNNKAVALVLQDQSKESLKEAGDLFKKAVILSKRRNAWKPKKYLKRATKQNVKSLRLLLKKKNKGQKKKVSDES